LYITVDKNIVLYVCKGDKWFCKINIDGLAVSFLFSFYVLLTVYTIFFTKLSQNLDVLQDQESLEGLICSFVVINNAVFLT